MCLSRKYVRVLHPETVSQREKINASAVTRPSPSELVRTRPFSPFPPLISPSLPLSLHTTHLPFHPLSLHAVWNIDVLFNSPSFCLCHNPSHLHTVSKPHRQDGIKTAQNPALQPVYTSERLGWRSSAFSSPPHYNQAIFPSTVCQFVSFRVINKSDALTMSDILPSLLVPWCTSLRQGIHWHKLSFSGHFCFHRHQRNLSAWARTFTRAYGHVCELSRMSVRSRNGKPRSWCVCACAPGLGLIIVEWVAINVTLIRKAFYVMRTKKGAAGWSPEKLQESDREENIKRSMCGSTRQ